MRFRTRQHGHLRVALIGLWLAASLMSPQRCWGADIPPSAPPLPAVQLPSPAIRVLSNGLKVVVIERHSLPLISVRLVALSGAEADPPQEPGIAQMVGSLLNQGTARRSAQELASLIDQVGGTIDTGADWDNSFVAVRLLTDHTELAFDLVSDMVMRPAFAQAEIERQRQQALSALKVSRRDPAYMADAVFTRLVLGGTHYGHPADGTEDSIRRMTAGDIRDFYARAYRPSNSILAVIGDIRPDEAFRLADKFFSAWKAGAEPESVARRKEDGDRSSDLAPAAERLPEPARHIVVIDKPDAVQTEIRIGSSGVPRSSPDFLALTVANQILGGPATNRLYNALRTEHGLTYNASSDLDCYRTAGDWVSKTSTRTQETAQVVRVALDELKRLRKTAMSDADLRTAQSYLDGHRALQLDSLEDLARQVLNQLVYGLPLDDWNRLPENLASLTPQSVLGVTQNYLAPDREVIVLVGNSAGFSRELGNLGEVRVIPMDQVDLQAPGLEQAGATGRKP